LVVEAPDRPGMLLAITLEVFQQGAQIVRSLVRTVGGRVFNHFELAEFNGAPLSTERCEQIRAAVYAALALRAARDTT
jgi:UTP:GlnB (protein PII) uridylyltransferase